ncbi:aladin isoform X2 [Austrofundulus limnaeus]|uniref:Aladin isoform X2 n=1 Tax=Austrofundulus limnaeus TaxID=52670 RepID=A0A2I4AJ82_AUSLI|nr:PREDICTED: aladin isoform X2 [Austrofundulus limnaeus]
MCSLALFPPLTSGQTTLCESNNELLSGSTNTEDPLKQDLIPLSLNFPRESLKLHSRTESSSKAAFLDHSETLWMRSAAAWRDGGLSGLLNEITTSHAEVPKWLSVTSGCILALLRWASSFHGSLFPHVTLSSEDMIAEFSQVLNWPDCVVRAFAWHPHTDKFAVALLDDSIKIYNPKSAITPTLKHRLQKNIAAVQWKPLCASALAVACQNCLLVWHVDPCSLSTRVWETRMWTCERWPCIKGRCQSGCWSPDGSRLLFTVQGEMVIYALTFTGTPGLPTSSIKGPQAAVVVADLSETTFKTPDGDIIVGGEIQSVSWDPRGERLAVLLKGDPQAANRPAVIAVFKTRASPIFELLPSGFVQGEPGTEPRLMQFHPNFRHGALLTVCWSSGRITHVPFYFLSSSLPHVGLSGSPPLPHPQERHADFSSQLFTELIS